MSDDPIDLGNAAEQPPAQQADHPRTLRLAVILLAIIAVLSAVTTIVTLQKVPQPANAAPVVTRIVNLSGQGTAIYWEISGPDIDLTGSQLPGALLVPVGSRVHLVALVNAADAESICTIRIDNVLAAFENGYGLDAYSDCDAVVR